MGWKPSGLFDDQTSEFLQFKNFLIFAQRFWILVIWWTLLLWYSRNNHWRRDTLPNGNFMGRRYWLGDRLLPCQLFHWTSHLYSPSCYEVYRITHLKASRPIVRKLNLGKKPNYYFCHFMIKQWPNRVDQKADLADLRVAIAEYTSDVHFSHSCIHHWDGNSGWAQSNQYHNTSGLSSL